MRGGAGTAHAAELAPRVITAAERLHHDRHDGGCDPPRHRPARAGAGAQDIAGKTGTTDEPSDTWFNGFNTDLVTTVWVGFDQERPLGETEEGSRTALPIWIRFMREALKDVAEQKLPMPDGLVQLRVSPETGTLVERRESRRHARDFMVNHLPAEPACRRPESADASRRQARRRADLLEQMRACRNDRAPRRASAARARAGSRAGHGRARHP